MKRNKPQFVAVFGKKRIGKTYLVRESFNHRFFFQHTGISNQSIKPGLRKQAQLDKFAESLRETGYACEERLGSWDEAFRKLKEAIAHSQEEKKIIFIDELSWKDTKESGLISALESFWNASHSCDGVRHMDVHSGKKKSACI